MNPRFRLTAGLGVMRTSTRYGKLREPGRGIKFAIEGPFRKQYEKHLGRGTHDASGRDMTTHHSTLAIRDAHVEVGSIARHRPGQGQDFKIAA